MNDRLLFIIASIVLVIGQHSTVAETKCRRLEVEASNETGPAIKLSWNVSNECQLPISYNITYGTIGGSLDSTLFKWKNGSQRQIIKVLRNLIPEHEYMIVITAIPLNRSLRRRAICQMSGKALPDIPIGINGIPDATTVLSSTTAIVTSKSTATSSTIIMLSSTSVDVTSGGITTSPTTVSSPTTAEPSYVGGIVGGVVALFVLSTVMVVVIALLSVWLFNRRRKQKIRNGLHYISVVQGIGNESKRGQLESRPGYLQIIHEAPNIKPEILHNNNPFIVMPATKPPLIENEYPRREFYTCADSNSSSSQITTETIQTSSVGTDGANGQIIIEQFVKPYAMVDIRDIGTDTSLEAAIYSHGVLDQLKAKHQRNETFSEALKKSFDLCLDSSTAQVKQPSSSGRYYTIPIYINLDIPMTVNPSYMYVTEALEAIQP